MSTFTTSDGVDLDVRDTGATSSGRTLVLVHGWSQSRATFDRVVPLLSPHHRVVSYDQRGHGLSGKPDHGARVARLAADLRELTEHLGLTSYDLVGHSMGASVGWSLIDNHGTGSLDSFLVLDQPSACVVLPWMTPEQGAEAGAILDFPTTEGFVGAVGAPDARETRHAFLASMLSDDIPADDLAHLFAENLRMPNDWGARLLLDHAMQDWRDVLPRIDVPVLVVGGEVSHVDAASQRWTAEHVPGAQLRVFTAAEGGSHFPFFEGPEHFAAALLEFVAGTPGRRA
jgi:pimeloyl-ACP methyl ester carboxylesterase